MLLPTLSLFSDTADPARWHWVNLSAPTHPFLSIHEETQRSRNKLHFNCRWWIHSRREESRAECNKHFQWGATKHPRENHSTEPSSFLRATQIITHSECHFQRASAVPEAHCFPTRVLNFHVLIPARISCWCQNQLLFLQPTCTVDIGLFWR